MRTVEGPFHGGLLVDHSIRWVALLIGFVAQELARQGDLHPIALLVGLALQGHVEVDGGHDAVAELLLDELLPGVP